MVIMIYIHYPLKDTAFIPTITSKLSVSTQCYSILEHFFHIQPGLRLQILPVIHNCANFYKIQLNGPKMVHKDEEMWNKNEVSISLHKDMSFAVKYVKSRLYYDVTKKYHT